MPTIIQLPTSSTITAADIIPVSQNGSTCAVSIGTLLAGTQPAIQINSSALLGRNSIGAGSPEQVDIGSGLSLTSTTLAANGLDHAQFPLQSSLQTTHNVVLSTDGGPALLPITAFRSLFRSGPNITITASGVISASASGVGVSGADISQLNTVLSVSPDDLIAVSHAGTTYAASISVLLNSAAISQTGTTTSVAAALPTLPSGTLPLAGDSIAMVQSGTAHLVPYGQVLNAESALDLQAAAAATDSDVFPVAQGSAVLKQQPLSALWPWIQGRLPSYRIPMQEVTASALTIDATFIGKLLLVTSACTITPNVGLMGAGFSCEILPLGNGIVTFAGSFPTSSGSRTLNAGTMATLYAVNYSGGAMAYAAMSGGGSGSATLTPTPTPTPTPSTTANWGGYVTSMVHSSGGNIFNLAIVGGTTPAQVSIGISSSSTTPPAQMRPPSDGYAGNFNGNMWGTYVTAPATAGTYYAWAIGYDSSANILFSMPGARITVT